VSEENILDFLRARFNRIDARLDEHSYKFDEVITRLVICISQNEESR
jgi:hypothetical protein